MVSYRAVASASERDPRPVAHLDPQLVARREMVRDELGMIIGAAQRLDPVGRAHVLLASRRAWDLAVGDVADEHVPEHVLRLAADSRAALAAQDPLAVERVERFVVRVDGSRPEHLPVDRGVLHDPLFLR